MKTLSVLAALLFCSAAAFFNPLRAQSDVSWLLQPKEGFTYQSHNTIGVLFSRGETPLLIAVQTGERINPPASLLSRADDQYWNLRQNELKGLWHPVEGVVVPPVFHGVERIARGLYRIEKYGMNALVNQEGAIVIPYQKKKIINGAHTFPMVRESYLNFQLLDRRGQPIGEKPVRRISREAFGFFKTLSSGGSTLLTEDGQRAFPDTYKNIVPASAETAWVQREEQWELINREGQRLQGPYTQLSRSTNGNATDTWTIAYLPEKGIDIFLPDGSRKMVKGYDKVFPPAANARWLTVKKNGRFGCMSPDKFKIVVKPEMEEKIDCIFPRWEKTEEGYQLISVKGKPVSSDVFAEVGPFNGNYAAARTGNQNWMLINKEGEPVTAAKYSSVATLPDGLFTGKDLQGQLYLLQPAGEDILLEGVFAIDARRNGGPQNYFIFKGVNGKRGLLHKSGKQIIPAEYEKIILLQDAMAIVKGQSGDGLLKINL